MRNPVEANLVVLAPRPPRPVALPPPAVALPAHHQAAQSDLPHQVAHLAVLQLTNLHRAVLRPHPLLHPHRRMGISMESAFSFGDPRQRHHLKAQAAANPLQVALVHLQAPHRHRQAPLQAAPLHHLVPRRAALPRHHLHHHPPHHHHLPPPPHLHHHPPRHHHHHHPPLHHHLPHHHRHLHLHHHPPLHHHLPHH